VQRYLFYPPFIIVHEETNFSDTWEAFCLKLLKLEYGTNEIERRLPPEQGIDLYYQKEKIAFQCKSTVHDSKFNIKKASDSLKSALPLKHKLPWSQYTICSNKNLTGTQVETLKAIDSNVTVRGEDSWRELCYRFPDQVKANFRVVCDVPENIIYHNHNLILNGELQGLLERLRHDPIQVLVYYHGNDAIYNFPLSKHVTVYDLLLMTRRLFGLEETTVAYKGAVHVKPYIKINNIRYDEQRQHTLTLGELGVVDGSCLSMGMDIHFPKANMFRSVMYANNKSSVQLDPHTILTAIFGKFDANVRG
jgi:hypothetical protein